MQKHSVNTQGRIIDVPSATQTDVISSGFATRTRRKSGPSARSIEARFWPKVHKTETCWLWTGSQGNTYGHGQLHIQKDGRNLPAYAHRIAWELHHGPIPTGAHVLHSCDVPLCVNPAHLFLGTQDANLKDAARKGRLHVPRERRQKVTDQQIRQMFVMRAAGHNLRVIAAQFSVTKSYVSFVLRGLRRQHGRSAA